MTSRKPTRIEPSVAFEKAISEAVHLRLRPGLQAIKPSEGKGQISAKDPSSVLGSVAIDDDCLMAHPNAARWDYVIGYARSSAPVAFFVEVHSAETSEVSKVEDKLAWLHGYLREEPQRKLAGLPREVHWVASGRISIPQHTPQFKKLNTTLRKLGLRGPVKSLVLA
jgi:hypothetical protein